MRRFTATTAAALAAARQQQQQRWWWWGAAAATASISSSSAPAAAAAAAAAASPAAAAASPSSPRLLEIREYTLHPSGMAEFLKLGAEHAALRKRVLPAFKGFFTCDTGGELNRLTHLYAYADMAERAAARAAAARDPEWAAYIAASRPYVHKQESRVMSEAAALYAAVGAPGAAAFRAPAPPPAAAAAPPAMYELRQYQLRPGYGSVPKLLEAFAGGLPDKIAADPEGKLVAFAYSEVGVLNNVVELWRYPSAAACMRARQASRAVPKWRQTIAAVTPGVQRFTTSFLAPTSFSPWQ